MAEKDTNQPEEVPTPESMAADEDQMAKLTQERDELFDRLARVQADYQNWRKRLHAEKDQAVQFANTNLIKTLLPVIDNFERALAVDPTKTDAAAILKGMQIVYNQWMNVLMQQSVQEIAPKPGDTFDPNHHQALMQQESEQYPENTVVQLAQKGYSLHGRTLRPAQVIVSKGK